MISREIFINSYFGNKRLNNKKYRLQNVTKHEYILPNIMYIIVI